MPAADELISTIVAPALGATLANCLFLAHAPAVIAAVRKGELGDVNPDPFPMILGNNLLFTTLGGIQKDPYIVASVLPGANAAVFYLLAAYSLAPIDVRRRMAFTLAPLLLVGSALIVWSVFGDAEQAVGIVGNVVSFAMFASPLSLFARMIREKTSAYIDRRFMVMQLVNCTCWIAYSLSVQSYYILPPNCAGELFGILQLAMVCRYPRQQAPGATAAVVLEHTAAAAIAAAAPAVAAAPAGVQELAVQITDDTTAQIQEGPAKEEEKKAEDEDIVAVFAL